MTISITAATKAPCKSWAVLLLGGTGVEREQGLAPVILQVFCGHECHTRSEQSEAGQGHDLAGLRRGEELSEKQEGTSGQRRK